MIYWIKRSARLFGGAVFFAVLLTMIFRAEELSVQSCVTALVGALLAGLIGWFIGVVIGDILIKGILADLGDGGAEHLVEGGILQRFQMMKEQLVPGGSEMPFVNSTPAEHHDRKKRKK